MTGLTVAPPTVPATLARSARRLMVLDTRGDPLSILRAVVRQRSARALHQRQLELPVDARRPLSPKGVEDLVMVRKSSCLMFRKDGLAISDDIEDPVLPLDKLRLDTKPVPDGGRQTGGLWSVLSTNAVGD